MADPLERRQTWSRIVGVERRQAPIRNLNGQPLPDPTRLEDEDFERAEAERLREQARANQPWNPWDDPDRSA